MDWNNIIRKEIRETEICQYAYAGEGVIPKVDCSLGASPVGTPPEVERLWKRGFSIDPSPYHSDFGKLTGSLIDFWGPVFEREEIVYGPGSISILFSLAFITGGEGASVLGISPQFPDVPSYFRFNGAEVRNVQLNGPDYALNVKDILASVTKDTTLVYLDQPHNPTGQYLPIEDVMELANFCEGNGTLLVVDEAYGGFMPEAESSINMRYESLISVRSFSKSWGLAGIRAGYAVIRNKIIRDYYKKVSPPFPFSVSMEELVPLAVRDEDYPPRLRKMVEKLKEKTMDIILSTKGFSVARTSMTVPIMLVSHENPHLDLFEHLLSFGIKTEPGTGFPGLGGNSVRLRVPSPDLIDTFKQCWGKASDSL